MALADGLPAVQVDHLAIDQGEQESPGIEHLIQQEGLARQPAEDLLDHVARVGFATRDIECKSRQRRPMGIVNRGDWWLIGTHGFKSETHGPVRFVCASLESPKLTG